jgi:hypothetical protein
MRTLYRHVRWTILGGIFGGLVSALLITWSVFGNAGSWPIRLMKINAWLGLQVFGDLYEGFPVISSPVGPNAVLVLFGALQWSLLGLVLDATRRWIRIRETSRGTA